jgi:sirohydrochlorin ferrochelatase
MTDNTLSHDAQGTNAPTPEATPGASSASNNTNGSNKRKRGAGAAAAAVAAPSTSSRGVANLTPEQLERKRANDREAQRAIRERTKQQIERLNERIKDLESSQPYRDLQAVIAQKDAVQQENDDIKRQLASFMATFQRYLNVPSGLEGILEFLCDTGRYD